MTAIPSRRRYASLPVCRSLLMMRRLGWFRRRLLSTMRRRYSTNVHYQTDDVYTTYRTHRFDRLGQRGAGQSMRTYPIHRPMYCTDRAVLAVLRRTRSHVFAR